MSYPGLGFYVTKKTSLIITMTATANGPYTVNAGNSVQLNASSNDPGSETYSYAWDLDNNGSFETDGQSVTFPTATLSPGDYTVRVQATDPSGNTAIDQTSVTINNPRHLSSLSPLNVWIGLQNSNSNGIKYDLKTEAYKDGFLLTSGELDSVDAGGAGFNNANLNTIPFQSFTPIDFPAGSQLSIKVLVRNACQGSKNNGKTARLWYNDNQANAQFGATIAGTSSTYYLRDNSLLNTTPGTMKKTLDVDSGTKCSSFKPFGTWTITP